jgi:hypothetical protein
MSGIIRRYSTDMADTAPTPRGTDPATMPDVFAPIISAAVFGYYGFLSGTTADITNDVGEVVPLWIGCLWILRLCTLVFIAITVVAFLPVPKVGLIFGAGGLLAAAGLLTVLVWSQVDQTYDFACHPLVLLAFAILNIYTSAMAIRASLR